MPKLIAVVGGKHSGKTTLIQHLIAELKRRGYHVGTIKEMVRVSSIDFPYTETSRHSEAGAEVVVAIPRNETVVFIKRRLGLNEVLPYLKGLDFVVLEGFEAEKSLVKIIAAKTAEEAEGCLDGLAIAVSGLIMESEKEMKKATALKIPLLKSESQVKEIADLVEQKAVTLNDTE